MDREKFVMKGYFFLKKVIPTIFNHHCQDGKDIVILSSPRSGSTWLMEMIYTQPRIKFINEPLGKNILDYNNLLPINTRWNYLTLTPNEEEILKQYFQTDKLIKYFGPINILNSNYNFFTNRRVFKVIRANALIEWFAKELNKDVIYLIRHPIAQSLSCINRKHHCEIQEYLNNHIFTTSYLNEDIIKIINNILKTGTMLEKFVTEWCLDNLVPLKKIIENNNGITVITYEELTLKPELTLQLIYERLRLQDKKKLFSKIKKPSKVTDSSSKKTKNSIKTGNSNFLVKKWKDQISEEENKKLFDIVKNFGINVYTPDNYLAEDNFLNFPPIKKQ